MRQNSNVQEDILEKDKNQSNEEEDQNIEDEAVEKQIKEVRNIQKELYSIDVSKDGKAVVKRKKESIAGKVLMINTILASILVIIIVFHLKGYF